MSIPNLKSINANPLRGVQLQKKFISSQCNVTTRTGEECKIRWQQLTSKVRQEIDSLKQTGGGKSQPLGELSSRVLDILKNPATEGMCGFDSSAPPQASTSFLVEIESDSPVSLHSNSMKALPTSCSKTYFEKGKSN